MIMEKQFSIDRIEAGIAVCIADDDLEIIEIPEDNIPGAAEGTCFAMNESGDIRIIHDSNRAVKNKERLNRLFKSKGDK